MSKLTGIKQNLYKSNKSPWNKDWNRKIKSILLNIEEDDSDISSIGFTDDFSFVKKDLFLGKYFYSYFIKNTKNSISLLYLFLAFMFSNVAFSLLLICSLKSLTLITFGFLNIIFMISLFTYYFIAGNSYYLTEYKTILYILKNDKFCFYSLEGTELIIRSVNMNDIKSITYSGNYYRIITNNGNNFSIYSKEYIVEIENLDIYKETLKSIEDENNKKLKEIKIIKKEI